MKIGKVMTLHITYCSKDKKESDGKIPAIERYDSERIEKVRELAEARSEKFAILSGKYSLINAETLIPEYDKLLEKQDIPELLPEVRNYLRENETEKVVYHTRKVEGKRKPYFRLIKEACTAERIDFEKRIISPDT